MNESKPDQEPDTTEDSSVNSVGLSELLAEMKSYVDCLDSFSAKLIPCQLIIRSMEMMEGMRASLKEVSDDHKHQINPYYNECEKDPCS